ncbi:MAG TPA: protein phosphatase 2C domain-containing protein [Bryobacteraceae bacterium]|jgi:serine/threonine protein phosphatase PrpC|nr:protein phosphatase 2C domain-containing protein [Bryobacteraceae bacterium]
MTAAMSDNVSDKKIGILKSAAASDPGLRRKNNEDRYYTDPDRGIFAVIDGVGGHAAGERAAQVAVDVIRERLERPAGTPEERLREAIALANNEIYRLSRTRPDWTGMACVLTVAVVEDDIVTVGHVGDSRLYVLRSGEIEKITHDHSPVGEREDRGEISEAEAMLHPRRNEIYRDVGSAERNPDDAGFIEVFTFPMPPDGALLLCSDGLTDLVCASVIRGGVERYAPDYEKAAQALIDTANAAGGKDNVTVVIAAAPDYMAESAVTTARRSFRPVSKRSWPVLLFAFGLILGVAVGVLAETIWNRSALPAAGPRTLVVGPAGINVELSQAHSGDTVVIPQGRYREHIEMREGVTLRAQQSGMVTLTSPDGKPAVTASNIAAGTLEGVWIQGDSSAPLSGGIDIVDSSPLISNVRITGAGAGIVVRGASAPLITSSQITNNLGPGMSIAAGAKPRIESNLIAANGNNGQARDVSPGIDVAEDAHPVLKNNGIVDNAAEAIWIHGRAWQPTDYEENFFGDLSPKEAIRVIEVKHVDVKNAEVKGSKKGGVK